MLSVSSFDKSLPSCALTHDGKRALSNSRNAAVVEMMDKFWRRYASRGTRKKNSSSAFLVTSARPLSCFGSSMNFQYGPSSQTEFLEGCAAEVDAAVAGNTAVVHKGAHALALLLAQGVDVALR